MLRRFLWRALVLAVVATCNACIYYQPLDFTASTEPTLGRSYEELGAAEGRSCQHSILGFATSDGGRLYDAQQAALKSRSADALIEATADTEALVVPFWRRNCVVVRGEAIRFER